jgi:hypothetical protein
MIATNPTDRTSSATALSSEFVQQSQLKPLEPLDSAAAGNSTNERLVRKGKKAAQVMTERLKKEEELAKEEWAAEKEMKERMGDQEGRGRGGDGEGGKPNDLQRRTSWARREDEWQRQLQTLSESSDSSDDDSDDSDDNSAVPVSSTRSFALPTPLPLASSLALPVASPSPRRRRSIFKFKEDSDNKVGQKVGAIDQPFEPSPPKSGSKSKGLAGESSAGRERGARHRDGQVRNTRLRVRAGVSATRMDAITSGVSKGSVRKGNGGDALYGNSDDDGADNDDEAEFMGPWHTDEQIASSDEEVHNEEARPDSTITLNMGSGETATVTGIVTGAVGATARGAYSISQGWGVLHEACLISQGLRHRTQRRA